MDHVAGVVDPVRLARLVTERTGMPASVQGEVEEEAGSGEAAESWWSRYGEWVLTGGSGLALAAGDGVLLAGAGDGAGRDDGRPDGDGRVCGGRRDRRRGVVPPGGAEPAAAAAGYRRPDGAGGAGRHGAGPVGRGGDGRLPVRAVRGAGVPEPGPRAAVDPGAAGPLAADGRADRRRTGRSRSCRPARCGRATECWSAPGDTIPVDGEVVSGRSSVDQKTITGESVPVVRGPGDPVYAGTVNGEGTLEIRAAGPVSDALISRVVAQVRASQSGRAPIERRISRFAAVYTPMVVGLSLLVMFGPPLVAAMTGHGWDWNLFREWFGRGLVVLVIACPCALVIATPVAVVSGLAAAARAGILIRGGEFLEEIGRLRALAFDKTGT